MAIDDVKRKLRAILSLSRDGTASEEEVDNAVRFASRLMAEHELSEADVVDAHDQAAEAERRDFATGDSFCTGTRISTWEAYLTSFVVKLVPGAYAYFPRRHELRRAVDGSLLFNDAGGSDYARPVRWYGDAETIRMARELFDDLRCLIAGLGRAKFGGALRGDGAAYCEGFVMGLHSKQQEQESAARAALPSSTALATIDRSMAMRRERENWAKGKLADSGVKLGCARGGNMSRGSSTARDAGYSDGRNHNVSAKRAPRLTT